MLLVKVLGIPTADGAKLYSLSYTDKKSLRYVAAELRDPTAGMYPTLTPYWATDYYVSDRIADGVQPEWATHVLFQ